MRIIHVITAFGIGGAEKLLVDIINRQVVKHKVYLVYLKKIDGLVPYLDKRVSVKHIKLSLFVNKELRQFYKYVKPDIIHTHLGHADFFGIWNTRNLKVKVFCTLHNVYIQKNILDRFYFKAYKYLFHKVSPKIKIISISKSVENHVLNVLKVPKKRSFVLYNSIVKNNTLEKKTSITKTTEVSNNITILFVGRLVKQKALHVMLKAIKVLKDKGYKELINVLIVGDGELKTSLENLSKNLKIDDMVTFEGEKKDTEAYYETADIFVLPSIWEGFGIVILEAFRSKLAVIASNIEGPSELITNNKNGLLFTPNNYIELSNKIIYLINNKGFRKQLAEEGYLSFNERYDINNYVDCLSKIYNEE